MSTLKNYSSRNIYIDNLKGILILLVVLGHFVEQVLGGSALSKSIFLFIYAFHMPLFIFLNGILFRHMAFDNTKITWRVVYFFSLYVALKGVLFFVKIIIGENPSFRLLSESGVPWYLFTLVLYYLIGYYLRDINKRYLLFFSILLALLCGYDPDINDFLVLSRTIVFFPFFLAGWMSDIDTISAFMQKPWIRLISLFLSLSIFYIFIYRIEMVYVLRPLFTGRNSYKVKALGEYSKYGLFLRLLTYTISIALSSALLSLTPRTAFRGIFSRLGRHSLSIYFLHRPVLYLLTGYGVFDALEDILGHRYSRLVWIFLSFGLTYLLSLDFFSKPFNALSQYLGQKNLSTQD